MTKQEAIDWAGGLAKDLAERLGISESAVSQWEKVPELQQYRLVLLSNGKLLLSPELFMGKTKEH